MQVFIALLFGLIIGWLAEWLIDWLYWRKRNALLASRVADLEVENLALANQLSNLSTDQQEASETIDEELVGEQAELLVEEGSMVEPVEVQGTQPEEWVKADLEISESEAAVMQEEWEGDQPEEAQPIDEDQFEPDQAGLEDEIPQELEPEEPEPAEAEIFEPEPWLDEEMEAAMDKAEQIDEDEDKEADEASIE